MILIVFVLFAACLNFISFFVDWEDTIHHGVRTQVDFGDYTDMDCDEHPWSRAVFHECQRSSGSGAVGSNVNANDCLRVCEDDPCASSRRISSRVIVWFTFISIGLLGPFLLLLIAGLFVNVWLPLVSGCFVITIVTTLASWLPFWLVRHGYVAGCRNVAFCPNTAARCDTHGFYFMFSATILLCIGGTLALFFDCIFLRFWGRKVDAIARDIDGDLSTVKPSRLD